jgi:hypothetical protein
MRTLFKAVLATVALAAPLYANAIPMTWNYSGVCKGGDCSDVPTITGTLIGDPTRRGDPNELNDPLFSAGDLTSYDFYFGDHHISGNDAFGTYTLDALGNITGGSMTFGNLFALQLLDVGSTWSLSYFDCGRHGCSNIDASGAGSYTSANSVPVPEPTTLSLLGLGLLVTGFVARRRKA